MNAATPLAPWLGSALEALLRQRGHAWLLSGPAGLGQYELALALAAAWLCDEPQAQGACGHCSSCHAVAVRTHADLCVLMPELTLHAKGWPLDEKAQTEIEDKKRKPSREIRVEALREALTFAQRTSARGRGKVVLVYPAERMNAIAANALLKTLEEPAGDLRFVLASESAWLLPPTIRSRCQHFALPWPASAQGQQWLVEQGVPQADALALLGAAGGRPDAALRLVADGLTPALWARLPRALQRGDAAALADQTPSAALGVLQKLCHDLMVLRVGAAPRFFDAKDLPAPPAQAVLARWAQALQRSARTVEHPFNPGLMLEALASQARAVLNSGTGAPS